MKKLIFSLTCLLLTIPCSAGIIIVDDDWPYDFNNIQAAIDYSSNGDFIYVFPATYTGEGNRDIDFLGKAITVQSIFPEDPYFIAATVIDCNGDGSGFIFQSGEDTNAVLAGLTIINGSGFGFFKGDGGGIYCGNSSPTITNCTITNNSAESEGGGILCLNSSPIIINCTISGNTAHEGGGGICCWASSPIITNCTISNNSVSLLRVGGGISCHFSSPTITNCTITNNTLISESPFGGGNGGGIYCRHSSPTITNCTISGNTAEENGGGIYCGEESTPTITNCTISANTARENGGGICCLGSSPTITNCTITGNISEGGSGGGIYCEGEDSSLTITNCTFNGNSAITAEGGGICYLTDSSRTISNSTFSGNSAENGGGMYNYGNNLKLTNCTFSGNSAINDGGGILANNEPISLINCILWGNTDSGGTDQSAQIHGSMPEAIFSCIQDDDPNDTYIPFGDANEHNIDDNPMFVRDPNDGGDGWGVGDNDDFGDLHLQKSSPCINAGLPNFWAGPNNVDIDGQPRIIGFRVDMGVDEFAPMIVVTKPQGGEVWAGESWHEITWYSLGISGTVDISYSSNNGTDWVTIDSNVTDTGSFLWYLPDVVDSNQCIVSVVPSIPDPNALCFESGLFTIAPDFIHPDVPSKWKTLGGDFDRTGLSENYGPELGCIKWQFEMDGAVSASPTIGAGDRVYIACENGKLYTLDIDDGSLLWSYDTNTPLISSPTVGPGGSVYVGGKDGKLYAISISGRLRWTHSTDGFIYSSPAVSPDGQSYVCSQDGALYALDRDGSKLWSFQTNGLGTSAGAIFASPAIGVDGTVYIGGLYEPNLYALDPNDGELKWACNFKSLTDPNDPNSGWPFASPVVAPDGTIYQTLLYDTKLYAINPNTGDIIRSTDLAGIIVSVGLHGERLIWYGPGDPPIDDPNSPYFGGIIKGRYRHAHCWSEPALALDGTIYVSFDDGHLRAVDPNGSIKWVTRLGMMGGFTLTVGSDGLIYAASDDGYLCAVSPDGEEISRFRTNDWLNFPVIAQDNIIIVTDAKNKSMLITDANNTVWAISSDGCEGRPLDLHRPQDLSADRFVNFSDFAMLAIDWLSCTDKYADPPCDYYGDEIYFTGDINKDLYVDFNDVTELTNQWLSED